MLRDVAVLALQSAHAFELGVFCEVFGIDRGDDALPVYDFALVSGTGDSVPMRHGFEVRTRHGLERLASADLICIPAYDLHVRQPDHLTEELRAAVERGARVLSICTGAFLLGEAGLLDGRRCTTHWRHTDELARRHPRARIESDVLYIDEDPSWRPSAAPPGPFAVRRPPFSGTPAPPHVTRPERANAVATAARLGRCPPGLS
ncbi:DJ-1/PfpI family protein [Kitasatospora aureofaciens]|uniref:DJ-1/PfpI family protein n=1 Tax=Kitasatospora aureofaciens TaxID=1894 RepID=UPI0033E72129